MATSKQVDFESLNDDELLKQEQQMKEMLEKIAQAKLQREENMKATAFKEIGAVLEKYVGSVITEGVLTDWLDDNQYLVTSKFEKVVEVKVAGTAVGRRKINDEDMLFAMPYKGKDGIREMTYKLDALSKSPAPNSGTHVVFTNLKTKTLEEIKQYFKPKFDEFKDSAEGKKWVKQFFPAQYDAIYSQAVEPEVKEFFNDKPVEPATM